MDTSSIGSWSWPSTFFHNDRRLGNLKFVAFAPHSLNHHRELKLAPPHHPKGIRGIGLLHAQTHVFMHLGKESFADTARGHILPLAARPGSGVHPEDHGQCRVIDLHRGQGDRIVTIGDRLSNLNLINPGHRHNIAGLGRRDLVPFEPLPAIQLGNFARDTGAIGATQRIDRGALQLALDNAPDSDPPDILIIVQVVHVELNGTVQRRGRTGQGRDNQVKEGLKILSLCGQVAFGYPGSGVGVHHGKRKLVVRGIEIDEEIIDGIQHGRDPGVPSVDFVNADNRGQPGFQGFLQNKSRLGQRPFRGVHQEHHPIDHGQRALDLAAEIRMTRRIDKIDFHAVIRERRVLGQNGNAAFPFQRKRVHHPLCYLFVVPKGAALFEQGVNQGRFAMIDMSDNGDVSNIITPGRAVVQNPILHTL